MIKASEARKRSDANRIRWDREHSVKLLAYIESDITTAITYGYRQIKIYKSILFFIPSNMDEVRDELISWGYTVLDSEENLIVSWDDK